NRTYRGVENVKVFTGSTIIEILACKRPKMPYNDWRQLMAQLTQNEIVKRCQAGESLSGENLANLDLTNQPLAGIDLSEANLSGTDLQNADLTDANLNDANLTGANLSGATLQRTYLVGSDLTDASFEEANLRGAFLSGSLLCGTNFRRADLRRATVGCPRCEMPGPFGSLTSFENANLGEAIFGEIKLKGIILLGANFKDAYLYEVDLSEAVYREADLEGAITKKGRN
ncbi:MAG: pentapeptide repeat-containing protein, partial [Candidatus Poribacteria bacterium]|nr:pentapeptide repeat-containing protein [Candidatus Poribacteria bacterium]